MDTRTLADVIDRIIEQFPAGSPGRPSADRKAVRVYLYRAVYERTRAQLQRQFRLTESEYKTALARGRALVKAEADGGRLDWDNLRDIFLQARKPYW